MTLHRLRLYYGALVLADHVVWVGLSQAFGLSLTFGLVWQVSAGLELLRLFFCGLALLPARFRLYQIRAIRWVSAYYFLLGVSAAWLAHTSATGNAFDLLVPAANTAAVAQSAWLLSVYAVLVLLVNARMIPRLHYL